MERGKCIEKKTNEAGEVIAYVLQDDQGNTQEMTVKELVSAVKYKKIEVDNLILTVNDTFIDNKFGDRKITDFTKAVDEEFIKHGHRMSMTGFDKLNAVMRLDSGYFGRLRMTEEGYDMLFECNKTDCERIELKLTDVESSAKLLLKMITAYDSAYEYGRTLAKKLTANATRLKIQRGYVKGMKRRDENTDFVDCKVLIDSSHPTNTIEIFVDNHGDGELVFLANNEACDKEKVKFNADNEESVEKVLDAIGEHMKRD